MWQVHHHFVWVRNAPMSICAITASFGQTPNHVSCKLNYCRVRIIHTKSTAPFNDTCALKGVWLRPTCVILEPTTIRPRLANKRGQTKHCAVADLRGARGMRAPSGSKFFQFHAVFGKIWQNLMLAPPPPGSWRPHLGEILDPPLLLNAALTLYIT